MQFSLTEEHDQLASSARKLLADTAGRMSPGDGIDRELLATLGSLDLLGLSVDESLGGAGAGVLELAVLAEEIGAALPRVPFAASSVVSTLFLAAHTEPESQAVVRRLVDGSATSTTAWGTFPAGLNSGSRSALTLRLDHGGVTGEIPAVPFGADADYLLVFVHTEYGLATALADLSGHGVNRRSANGFDLSEPVATIVLDQAWPLFVGTPVCTATVVERVAPGIFTALAAELVGTGQRALDNAVAYAKQREQFGRVIGSFQAIKHLLADRHVQLDAARALVHYAAWAADNGEPGAELAARTALAAASEAALAAAADNLQTHGGIGFTWEQSAHRYLRRARARRSLLGSPARQLDLVADHVLAPA
ncbi:acyl-CoA dehydrogenase family protein [Amycolatopsis sp.]|jgi:alkylation response protein AidB-like acyl-CoA dehydrogenase|uniref:acyl-CoA dehydrogenase family protein n=1 Tax=Amycolatopsis sp. TaxID=37632 RepID=UPI002E002999|nr:acyl-CoA dehydrogenase family protein [Amycolatopsis sp.]